MKIQWIMPANHIKSYGFSINYVANEQNEHNMNKLTKSHCNMEAIRYKRKIGKFELKQTEFFFVFFDFNNRYR